MVNVCSLCASQSTGSLARISPSPVALSRITASKGTPAPWILKPQISPGTQVKGRGERKGLRKAHYAPLLPSPIFSSFLTYALLSPSLPPIISSNFLFPVPPAINSVDCPLLETTPMARSLDRHQDRLEVTRLKLNLLVLHSHSTEGAPYFSSAFLREANQAIYCR